MFESLPFDSPITFLLLLPPLENLFLLLFLLFLLALFLFRTLLFLGLLLPLLGLWSLRIVLLFLRPLSKPPS